MKDLDEKTALAIIFANTKRQKRTVDLLTLAHAFDCLTNFYGSQKVLAKKVGLSDEMIREFRKILTLAPEVKEMINSRSIDKLDVAYRLSKIEDQTIQIKAAREFSKLKSKDIRNIERLISSSGLSVDDSIKTILESKLKELHVFIVDFNEDDYSSISKNAKDKNVMPAELIKQIVLNWLYSTGKNKVEE